MDQGKEAAIQARAYEIWRESGGAHGHDEDHWRQAEAEYGGGAIGSDQAGGPAKDVPAPSAPHEDGVSPFPPRSGTAGNTRP